MKSILITTCITQESPLTIIMGDAEPISFQFQEEIELLITECGITKSEVEFGTITDLIKTASYLDEDDNLSFGLLLFENVKSHQVIVLDLDYLTEVLVSEETISNATLGYLCSKYLPVDAYVCDELIEKDEYFYSEVESVETGTKYLILKTK